MLMHQVEGQIKCTPMEYPAVVRLVSCSIYLLSSQNKSTPFGMEMLKGSVLTVHSRIWLVESSNDTKTCRALNIRPRVRLFILILVTV